ncbi:signal peptide peptidase SppA [Candidatus Woesearchaeota archaeon]|nr:signal peptide peptidase SppA [Candidatus Woesearchaeota archaeon]
MDPQVNQPNKWKTVASVLVALYLISSIGVFFFHQVKTSIGGKIIVVPLNGVIQVGSAGNPLFFSSDTIVSGQVVKQLEELQKDDSVKAVLFEMNSPGGSAIASQEIADAIKKLHKPTSTVIREVGASGGYWIASSTDKIYASPMSITGSIGVISSYLQFSDLFEKYGVTYERLVAGKYKDVGTPYKNLTTEERALLQQKLDLIHTYFIQTVAANRHLSEEKIRTLATGEFYLGTEAKDLGLIDAFGDRNTALDGLKQKINQTDIEIVDL